MNGLGSRHRCLPGAGCLVISSPAAVKVVPAASAARSSMPPRMTTVPDDPVDLQSWANALPWSHQATIVALVTFFSEGTAAGPGDRDEHRARLCEIVGRAIMPDALLPGPYFAYLIKHNETIFSGVRESLGLMARALSSKLEGLKRAGRELYVSFNRDKPAHAKLLWRVWAALVLRRRGESSRREAEKDAAPVFALIAPEWKSRAGFRMSTLRDLPERWVCSRCSALRTSQRFTENLCAKF